MSDADLLTPEVPEAELRPASEPRLLRRRAKAKQAAIEPHAASAPLPHTVGTSASAAGDRLSLRHTLYLWRRYRRLVLGIVGLCLAGTAVKLLVLTPDIYMAQVTVLPSGGQGQSSVMGLLASFTGAPPPAIGGAVETNSSALFPRILKSRVIGLQVLRATYAFQYDGQNVRTTLYAHLRAENEDEALLALDGLRAIDVDKETGVITVSVRTPNPQLSAQICDRYVQALEAFNSEERRTMATLNSEFARERLEQTLSELAAAEERLARFKSRNVRMNDPELELGRMRLERDVALKSQVFATLTSQVEVARIEESKNIPVVRVLDRAHEPAVPVAVPVVASMAGGGILGIVAALFAVAAIEFWRYLRTEMQSV